MVNSLFPILTTRDLGAALGFYRDLLGGAATYEFPAPDGEPGYVGLEVGSSQLGIGRDPDATDGPSARFSLWAYSRTATPSSRGCAPPACQWSRSPPTSPGASASRGARPGRQRRLIGQAAA